MNILQALLRAHARRTKGIGSDIHSARKRRKK